MSELRRWQMRDPMLVLEQKQAMEAKRGKREGKSESARKGLEELFEEVAMTLDQIEQVEELLIVWYGYESAYRPALGAPRISPSSRGYSSGNVYDSADETDELLNRVTAEAVGLCVDELTVMERAAIQVQMRNMVAKAAIHRSPRTEDQRRDYYSARERLWDKFLVKGLVRC